MNQSTGTAILILESLTQDQLNLFEEYQCKEVYMEGSVQRELEVGTRKAKLIELTPEDKKEINYQIFNRIKQFSEYKVSDETIGEKLTIDGMSFWYYMRFRSYYKLRNLYYQVALIEKLRRTYSTVVVFHRANQLDDFFLNSEGVESCFAKSVYQKEPINFRYILRYFASMFARTIGSFWKTRALRKKKHLILTNAKQYGTISGSQGNKILFNKFFAYALKTDRNDFGIVDLLFPPKIRGSVTPPSFKLLLRKENYSKIGGEVLLLRYGPLRPSNWKRIKATSKKLKEIYSELQLSKSNDPIERFLCNEVSKLHSSFILYYAQHLSYRKFLSKCKFETVTTIDENSANTKVFIDAAKFHGILTHGVQHGAIHELHPAYVYAKHEKKYSPFPDKTIVWGEYYKYFLQKNSCYSSNEIEVIGQLRTDVLFKEEFKAGLNSDEFVPKDGKTIVTFASQPQRDEKMRKKAASDFLLATKELNDVLPIIKIHPNEKKEYYEMIANSLDCEVLVLGAEIDLFVLLKKTDILVTCFSTVGAEGVFMKIPLIVLDYLNQDSLLYIEKGVGSKAISAQEISSQITSLIENNFSINDEHYSSFIFENAYKIDGQVTDRFMSEICGN